MPGSSSLVRQHLVIATELRRYSANAERRSRILRLSTNLPIRDFAGPSEGSQIKLFNRDLRSPVRAL
jgi:hypothetical protein